MTQHTTERMDVQQFIDGIPVSGLQKVIILLCFFVAALDGFDIAAVGFIAPALIAEWSLTPADLAPLFLSGVFGLMLGSFIFGPLADKFGRKKIIIWSVIIFSIGTLISAFSPSLTVLIVLRFLTGLGLGGAMPNAVTITSEYCPTKRRSTLVTVMFCGYTIGAAMGGLLAGQLIQMIGWQGILIIGGVAPLVILPLLYCFMPESLRFMVLNKFPKEKIDAVIQKMSPKGQPIPELVASVTEKQNVSVRELFSKDYFLGTILFWCAFTMGSIIIYMISSWMPTILKNEGFDMQSASWITSAFQIGGTVGALIIAFFMDKLGHSRTLTISYIVGAICVLALSAGVANLSTMLIVLGIFGIGAGISGSHVGIHVFCSSYYPTHCRSTGVSWAGGAGRLGSFVGSGAVGWLMVSGLSGEQIVNLLTIPAFLAAISMFLLTRLLKKNKKTEALNLQNANV
ncbi:aromatic acid/H+ symport family MFS transporter [Acinetobacter sp. ANC 3903]|uniref:MFS transporter n=1 Tax=Acinetobacter sp. ANC 3903 TaxID=1977883 RepID=UPI000A3442BB|nr:aromatic acid/H+ symport family MFS transporter [Acinetobacter sp. ANC 3903]OTG58042.1 aromatic acid/H+ symport family MFS transporter [Acinetobacter sp. ANC 3903]